MTLKEEIIQKSRSLSADEVREIVRKLLDRLETEEVMRISERSFAEWEQEEDLYTVE